MATHAYHATTNYNSLQYNKPKKKRKQIEDHRSIPYHHSCH